jgi:hypothetical protein
LKGLIDVLSLLPLRVGLLQVKDVKWCAGDEQQRSTTSSVRSY